MLNKKSISALMKSLAKRRDRDLSFFFSFLRVPSPCRRLASFTRRIPPFSRSPHKGAFAGLFSHISAVKCPNLRSLFVDIHPAHHTGYLKLSTTLTPTVSSCSSFHSSSFSPREEQLLKFSPSSFFSLLLGKSQRELSVPPSLVRRTCARTVIY